MTNKSPNPGQRFTAGQIRTMTIAWIAMTVVVGIGTFVVLFSFLGGSGAPSGAPKSASDLVTLEIVATTMELQEQPQSTLHSDKDGDTDQAVSAAEQDSGATSIPQPTTSGADPELEASIESTATSAVVLPTVTGFNLGGQVIHG